MYPRLRWGLILLFTSMIIVALWEVAALLSHRPWKPFARTARDYAEFNPVLTAWTSRVCKVPEDDPTAPNLLSLALTHDSNPRTILVRLVHGYNMPMCMKIKGYTVALLEDKGAEETPTDRRQWWSLMTETGVRYLWMTRMVRADTLEGTTLEVGDMLFPRVQVPDDPRWIPRGLTWNSLRHPWANLKESIRARWNASRCDWLTFLRLRQPAWASDEIYTIVSATVEPCPSAEDAEVRPLLDQAQKAVWSALKTYPVPDHTGQREER